MALFYFTVTSKKIETFKGEVEEIPKDFNQYTSKSFGESDIYYKIKSGKISEIICDTAVGEDYARQEVKELLESINIG